MRINGHGALNILNVTQNSYKKYQKFMIAQTNPNFRFCFMKTQDFIRRTLAFMTARKTCHYYKKTKCGSTTDNNEPIVVLPL